MPDLKSEMFKVINQWNDDDMPTTPTTMTPAISSNRAITTNSTRTTFNYVRDNPGVSSTEATNALDNLGVPKGSSTSLLSIMVSRGNIRKTADGALFAAQQEYKPIKKDKPKATMAQAVPVPVVEAVAPPPVEWSVESVIGSLNVRQAMAVYDELRKIFGA